MKFANKLSVALLLLTAMSCGGDTLAPSESLTFKVTLGQESTFQVTEEVYSVSETPKMSSFFIKENVVDEETSSFESLFTVEQWRKSKETDSWKINSVYKVRQTPDKIIQFVNNLPVVVLTFPVNNEAVWNKNSYNTDAEVKLGYQDIGEKFESFTPTYTVVETNDSTLIDLKRVYEVYSPSKGLVYKEKTLLNYCQSTPACIGKGEISYGIRSIWKRID